jgi:hypothetical protein
MSKLNQSALRHISQLDENANKKNIKINNKNPGR